MKRIVVCCDGTWNREDQRFPTNVAKMYRAVLPVSKGIEQRVIYDRGVGTGGGLDRFIGLFGGGLSRNVQDAYRFVVENYDAGDELYFFGFSRGAYTVRSTVGLIRKCGVLRRDQIGRVDEAYRLYRSSAIAPDAEQARRFRREHSVQREEAPMDVTPVRFMGVWDTVGALGIPVSRSVEHACQALAIDEKRVDYSPTLWEQHPQAQGQVLEQRWFAGSHADIGGGVEDSSQSDRAFLWLKRRAAACGLGFDETWIAENVHEVPVGAIQESRTGIFLLRKLFYRPIGRGVAPSDATYLGGIAREVVDPSVIARNVADGGYRPRNLVSYFREHPEALTQRSNEPEEAR